jgi:hypothetical protein
MAILKLRDDELRDRLPDDVLNDDELRDDVLSVKACWDDDRLIDVAFLLCGCGSIHQLLRVGLASPMCCGRSWPGQKIVNFAARSAVQSILGRILPPQ